MVTHHPEHGPSVLAIQRADNLAWALPGGKLDRLPSGEYESPESAMARELGEEANVWLSPERFENGVDVYRGMIKGTRDTDNAWLETAVRMVVVPWTEAKQFDLKCEPGGTIGVAWVPVEQAIGREQGTQLSHAGHWRLVRRAWRLAKSGA